MPENDFEKQVQQLFDELKLKPSAAVWPKLSARIRKEKNRRRGFIWIPLAFLLLGSGGYWLLHSDGDHSSVHHFPQPAGTSANDEENAIKAQSLQQNNPVTTDNKQNTDNTVSSGIALNTDGSGSDSPASENVQSSGKPPVTLQAPRNVRRPYQPAVQLPAPENTGNNNTVTTPVVAVRQTILLKKWVLPEMVYGKRVEGISAADLSKSRQDAGIGKTNIPVQLAKKKSWEWGIVGGAGTSMVSDGFPGLGKKSHTAASPDMNNMPNTPNRLPNSGFFTTQNTLGAVLPSPASPVKNNMAWQAGGFVKRKMNARLAVTGGLQYHYASTNREVGRDISSYGLSLNTMNQVNASYGGYYMGNEYVNYTNRYHFFEMPAGVEWQLNKSAKLPLLINGGVALSYLVNTTALHYHPQTGSYYKDKALYNKIQTGIYAGASFEFFAKSRNPLYGGPVMQYNVTNLLKPSLNLGQHLVFVGLKAEWVLGKR